MKERQGKGAGSLGLTLPESLRRAADVAGNGEWFWLSEHAVEAATWLAERDIAIVGGEIYHRHDRAWGSYLAGWATEPVWEPEREPWHGFVARGFRTVREVVESDIARQEAQGRSELHIFFLAYTSEAEWLASQHGGHRAM